MRLPLPACAAAAMALAVHLPASSQTGGPKIQQLAGAWTLVNVMQTNADGSKVDVFGPSPLGTFLVTPDGHCSVQFMRNDLPKFKSGVRTTGTPEENTAVVRGSLAYNGSCTIDGPDLVMLVKASTFPAWIGQTQRRKLTLDGDELRWVGITGAQGASIAVTLKRAK